MGVHLCCERNYHVVLSSGESGEEVGEAFKTPQRL
jgi:hypothetical protein